MDKQPIVDDSGVWHNTSIPYRSWRPMDTIAGDGSYFSGKHELKFGLSWRKTAGAFASTWPGNKTITFFNGYPNLIVEADADHPSDAAAKYVNGWISDTYYVGPPYGELRRPLRSPDRQRRGDGVAPA